MKSFSLPLVSGVLCFVLGIMGSFMPTFWGALEYAGLAYVIVLLTSMEFF
jgi:hypothetical protein